MSLLQQLKDYDKRLTEELAAKAFQGQEKKKLEMEMLSERQNEERKKFREQMDNDL